MAPAKVYKEKDANKNILKNKTLAVIGYGSQGHAHALNLKDSGYNVIVGLYPKSKSIEVAKKQGFKVLPTAEAVKAADVIMIAVPDMIQADLYEKEIAPNLTKGKTLVFLHGLSIHSGLIKVPAGINVIMVAPKGPKPHCSFAIPRKQGRTRPHRCCAGRKRRKGNRLGMG